MDPLDTAANLTLEPRRPSLFTKGPPAKNPNAISGNLELVAVGWQFAVRACWIEHVVAHRDDGVDAAAVHAIDHRGGIAESQGPGPLSVGGLFGVVGKVADRTILGRFADATVRNWVDELAVALVADEVNSSAG